MRKMDYHRAVEAQETFVDDTPAIAPAPVDVLVDWLRTDAAECEVELGPDCEAVLKEREAANMLEELAALVRPRVIRDCRPVLAAVGKA